MSHAKWQGSFVQSIGSETIMCIAVIKLSTGEGSYLTLKYVDVDKGLVDHLLQDWFKHGGFKSR